MSSERMAPICDAMAAPCSVLAAASCCNVLRCVATRFEAQAACGAACRQPIRRTLHLQALPAGTHGTPSTPACNTRAAQAGQARGACAGLPAEPSADRQSRRRACARRHGAGRSLPPSAPLPARAPRVHGPAHRLHQSANTEAHEVRAARLVPLRRCPLRAREPEPRTACTVDPPAHQTAPWSPPEARAAPPPLRASPATEDKTVS